MNSREIFGAEIQYFRTDPEYWEPIIRRFKDTGLRCVTSYIPWEMHAVTPPDAKHPAGVLDFTGRTNPRLNLRRFLDLIEKHRLNLNFRSGPFCCNEMRYGGHPRWVVVGDPRMMVWDYQNRPAQGYWLATKEGSQPSYLHGDYLAMVRAWLEAADRIAAGHLRSQGGCITMVNLDNETSYIVRDSFLGSDYNPVNVEPGGFYHRFLAEKYGSAGGLPYDRKYSCIEDVPAPRSVPDELGRDLPYYLDWAEFKQWTMCEYLRRLREMHEANGLGGVTFMTNFNPHRPEGIPTRMPAFEKATGGITGYDFYRGTFMSYSGYHSMARVLKLMNASLTYTWSAEFMSGTWHKVLKARVSCDHMRFMARCALAHGCKAISWFMFHDRDTWGDAPVSSHGHPRPSLEVLTEIPRILFGKVRDWDALVPQCDVGIVYDLAAARHCHVGDPMPCADDDLHVGPPAVAGVAAGETCSEYEGLFRLVEQAGAQAGAIDIMHDPAELKRYKLVFLPGGPVIEQAANESLRKYVSGGGVLVVTGAMPTVNEIGARIRFLGRAAPKGSRREAVVRIGRGKLIWRGDYIAHAECEKEDLRSIACVASLLKAHRITPHVRITPSAPVSWIDWGGGGAMLYRQPRNLASAILHRGPKEAVLFVLNHYPEAAKFDLEFGRMSPTGLTDLTTGRRIAVHSRRVTLDDDRTSCEIYRVR